MDRSMSPHGSVDECWVEFEALADRGDRAARRRRQELLTRISTVGDSDEITTKHGLQFILYMLSRLSVRDEEHCAIAHMAQKLLADVTKAEAAAVSRRRDNPPAPAPIQRSMTRKWDGVLGCFVPASPGRVGDAQWDGVLGRFIP
jgi:hypothetical protein